MPATNQDDPMAGGRIRASDADRDRLAGLLRATIIVLTACCLAHRRGC